MAIDRVNFADIPDGGDSVTAALVKLDGNCQEISEAIGDAASGADSLIVRVDAIEAITDGLGNASTKNVGTTAGTVSAGDDIRFGRFAFRNLLINGAFDWWQRGEGVTFSSATMGGAFYVADRWQVVGVSNTNIVGRVETAPQGALPRNVLKFSVTSVISSGSASFVSQKIEGVRSAAGKTVTVSFKAWSSVSGKKIGVSFDQNFGTGGAPSANVLGVGQSVTLGNVAPADRQSLTFAIADVSGSTVGSNRNDNLQMVIWIDGGSDYNARSGNIGQLSADVYLDEVQVEIGSAATEFERRPVGLEYVMCRRFYRKSFPYTTAPAQSAGIAGAIQLIPVVTNQGISTYVAFDQPMRAAPSVRLFNPSAANANWRDSTANADRSAFMDPISSDSGFGITSASTGVTAGNRMIIHYDADAEI